MGGKKNIRLCIAFIMVLVFATVMFAGCGQTQTSNSGQEEAKEQSAQEQDGPAAEEKSEEKSEAKKWKILMVPKLVGIPYIDQSALGADWALEKLGIEIMFVGPTKPDAVEQVKIVEDYISKGVDAIAVSPNDPAALTPILNEARAKGIRVIDWDTPAEKDAIEYSVQPIDEVEYGENIWDLLVKHMGDSGDYAIITGGLNAANLNNWIEAGLKHAKENYPGLNLVTERIPTDEKQQVAYQKALEVIKAYPELDGIIGISSPAPPGIGQAIQEKGLQDKIAVVGTGMPNMCKDYIMDGSIDESTLWDPAEVTYVAAYIMKCMLENKEITDGMEVPDFGKISVKGKDIVIGKPLDLNKDNVQNYNF
jgi:ABC-type sugar transport system substrate-binding protein